MWKTIRDWLCPVILEQEEQNKQLKKAIQGKDRDITVLTSKVSRWEKDFNELNSHH